MAVPARRVSKTRKRMRNTHYKITGSTLVQCPNCNETIRPHRVCTKCGHYKGKEVISTETK